MTTYLSLLFTMICFFSISALSEKLNNCPNQNLERFEFTNFPVYQSCPPQSVENKLTQAMNFILNTDLIKLIDSSDQSFKPSSSFRRWRQLLINQVSEFVYIDSCGSEDVVAYVRKELPGTIYLCANMISDDQFTTFDLVAAILHEIRHFSGPGHIECSHGQKKYSKACDESIDIQGSYAFSLWSYVELAYGAKNIHPVTRLLARANADVLIHNNFNRLPIIELKKTLVGTTIDGDVFKVEKDQIQLMNVQLNQSGSIFILNNFWYLVSQKDFQIKTIFNPLFSLQRITQVYQDDFNFSVNHLNLKLVDFYKLDQTVGLLEKNKLIIACPNKNYEFKTTAYHSFIISDRNKSDTIRLLKKDGHIDTFYCDVGRFDKVSYDSESIKNSIRIVKINDREYSLNNIGELYSRMRLNEGGYSHWQILNQTGPKIQSIQLYDSKLYFDQLQLPQDE